MDFRQIIEQQTKEARDTSAKLYADCLARFSERAPQNLDRNWLAFLRLITTGRGAIFRKLEPVIDWSHAEVDFNRAEIVMGGCSTSERRIFDAAKALYQDEGKVDLAGLAALDTAQWEDLLDALRIYRGK